MMQILVISLLAFVFLTSITNAKSLRKFTAREVTACVEAQTELYGDLCAEARSCEGKGDDDQTCNDKAADLAGYDSLLIRTHFEGVKCGAEAVANCLGIE